MIHEDHDSHYHTDEEKIDLASVNQAAGLNSDGSKPDNIHDDVTHPDGSQSDIPYWLRRKIGELDNLANEIQDWLIEHCDDHFEETLKGEQRDILNEYLTSVMGQITLIQEQEKWI